MEHNCMLKVIEKDTYDLSAVPYPCQPNKLSKTDPTKTCDESKKWIKGLRSQKPVWSCLYALNCAGYCRRTNYSREKNYCVEIPQHLLSLWGTETLHTKVVDKLSYLQKYQWICNVLICCAAVKYNPENWSRQLLDDVLIRGCSIYEELCRKHALIHKDFSMHHMNTLMKLKNTTYKINIEKKYKGIMYLPCGHRGYNLSRALMEFFGHYQFGLLLCDTRCVAFGFATDVDKGYFMYDCQCLGPPLLNQGKANAYVLRTDHLQILLHCLTVALRVNSDNVPFNIYNVDVRIEENDVDRTKNSPVDKFPINFYGAYDDVKIYNPKIEEVQEYSTGRLLQVNVKGRYTSLVDRIADGNEKVTASILHSNNSNSLSKSTKKSPPKLGLLEPPTEQKKIVSISAKGLIAKNISRKGKTLRAPVKKVNDARKRTTTVATATVRRTLQ